MEFLWRKVTLDKSMLDGLACLWTLFDEPFGIEITYSWFWSKSVSGLLRYDIMHLQKYIYKSAAM